MFLVACETSRASSVANLESQLVRALAHTGPCATRNKTMDNSLQEGSGAGGKSESSGHAGGAEFIPNPPSNEALTHIGRHRVQGARRHVLQSRCFRAEVFTIGRSLKANIALHKYGVDVGGSKFKDKALCRSADIHRTQVQNEHSGCAKR